MSKSNGMTREQAEVEICKAFNQSAPKNVSAKAKQAMKLLGICPKHFKQWRAAASKVTVPRSNKHVLVEHVTEEHIHHAVAYLL